MRQRDHIPLVAASFALARVGEPRAGRLDTGSDASDGLVCTRQRVRQVGRRGRPGRADRLSTLHSD